MSDRTIRVRDTDPPRPFSLATVDKELRALWREASTTAEDGAVLRACVHNLVIWDDTGQGNAAAAAVALSREEPGRVFLLEFDEQLAEGELLAEVTAVCHLRRGGGHICGEQIHLRAHPTAAGLLPSVVRSLQLSELSTSLWATGALPFENPAFQRLLALSDRCMFDSAHLTALPQRAAALEFARAQIAAGKPMFDLAWSRTHGWRNQLADAFEPDVRRHWLPELRRVEIDHSFQDTIPSEALYLTAWVASRLGWSAPDVERESWEAASTTGEIQSEVFAFFQHAHASQIRLTRAEGPADKLLRFQLETAHGEFVRLEDDGRWLHTRVSTQDHAPLPSLSPSAPVDLAMQLSRHLVKRSVDPHFLEALQTTLVLLHAGGDLYV